MAFKLKFQGKSKELYGPDNPMVRKGLVTPAYLMEGPGDEKKVKAEADKKASENMKVVKTETRKVDGGTEKIEYLEGIGKAEGFSKDPSEREKQKQWIKDNPELYEKLLAEKKKTDKKVTFIPDDKPEEDPQPDTKPQQTAKTGDKNIGTRFVIEKVLNPQNPYKSERINGKLVRTPNYIDVKRRVAVSATGDDKISKDLDQNVQYSSTGDADRVENVVADQLKQKGG